MCHRLYSKKSDDFGSYVFQEDLIVQTLIKERQLERGLNSFLYSHFGSICLGRLCEYHFQLPVLRDDTTCWRSQEGQVEAEVYADWLTACWFSRWPFIGQIIRAGTDAGDADVVLVFLPRVSARLKTHLAETSYLHRVGR